jgi:transcriptional regulator of acetoin/glycerol metabolism
MTEVAKRNLEAAVMLRARFRVDPVGARTDIVRALETAAGNATQAAVLLGVGRRTLNRYLQDAQIMKAIEAIRTRRQRQGAA